MRALGRWSSCWRHSRRRAAGYHYQAGWTRSSPRIEIPLRPTILGSLARKGRLFTLRFAMPPSSFTRQLRELRPETNIHLTTRCCFPVAFFLSEPIRTSAIHPSLRGIDFWKRAQLTSSSALGAPPIQRCMVRTASLCSHVSTEQCGPHLARRSRTLSRPPPDTLRLRERHCSPSA